MTRPAAGPWVSVGERRPKEDSVVLVAAPSGVHLVEVWCSEPAELPCRFVVPDGDDVDDVTHWAEILPPEGK